MDISNLYQLRPQAQAEEIFNLLQSQRFKLEQICSYGKASPVDFWYDQAWDEWVVLLQGTAILEFQNQSKAPELVQLKAGDYLLIQAHCRHRVAFTSLDAIWLALHFPPENHNL